MKILFTSHRFEPDIGGIEVNADVFARFFVSRGHEVRLVTQTIGNDSDAVPFPVIRRPSASRLVALHRWADVVYQNNIELGTLWPRVLVRRPTVVSIRTWIRGIDGRVRMVDRLKKWTLGQVDAVVANSEAIRKATFDRAIVIGNPYRNRLFREIPEIPRGKSIAFLGRFVSDKGADLLLRAFAQIQDEGAQLTLIGAGPEEKALRSLAGELGLKVHFTGPLRGEDLVRELNSHLILAVPSMWEEPFGNVALEGLACGCSVVGSNNGGLPDAIGPAGVLFERGNAKDLAAKLRLLLRDQSLRDQLHAKSPNHLKAHHEEVVCERYLKILTDAAGR